MPYVTEALLETAVDALRGKHPLAVVVLPAMVHAGVDVIATAEGGRLYGSDDELAILREYFASPGGPPQRPFKAVWDRNPTAWVNTQYPGRALQRQRTDRAKKRVAFYQAKRPSTKKDLWGLRADCGAQLSADLRRSEIPVRVVDLAIWYGRTSDITDLDDLVRWFMGAFPLDKGDLIGTVYDPSIPDSYRQVQLGSEMMASEGLNEAIETTSPTAPVGDNLSAFITGMEDYLAGQFMASPGFVSRVIQAWMRGDIVILVGQPGTGKTRFARLVDVYLTSVFPGMETIWLGVRADFDEAEMIGYERLDGSVELRDFTKRVLRSPSPQAPHLVVLEEFNLATIEAYLSSVLIATQDSEREVTLPANGKAYLPVDTFFLATCNSYQDEPETRHRVSYPTKRRSCVITMPNILSDAYQTARDSGGDTSEVILNNALAMIEQERERIEQRQESGRGAAFDGVRSSALQGMRTIEALSGEVRIKLVQIVSQILDTPEGGSYFTLGLLRDIILDIAYANRDAESELTALGDQVADKLIQQLRGPQQRADDLLTAIQQEPRLPNEAEIVKLLERMKAGPGIDLMPLL